MRTDDQGLVVGMHRSNPHRELIRAALDLGITRFDTAYNYRGGASHQLLRQQAGTLLAQMRVSTKVGFFPGSGGVEHSLDPIPLLAALRQSNTTLGITPEVVFLHNPERSVAGLSEERGVALLAGACDAMRKARREGLCRDWGISSWAPEQLLPYLTPLAASNRPDPAAVMLRCGLTVPGDQLIAGQELIGMLKLTRSQVWGMSPFGGSPRDPVWTEQVSSPFLAEGTRGSPLQVALRVGFEVPGADRVAVGVSSMRQLHELYAGTRLRLNTTAITEYTKLVCRN